MVFSSEACRSLGGVSSLSKPKLSFRIRVCRSLIFPSIFSFSAFFHRADLSRSLTVINSGRMPPAARRTTLDEAKRYVALFDRGRLRVAREARGLSQTELASAIQTTAPAISQFEGGTIKPSAKTLAEISTALRFPVAFFARHRSQPERTAREAFFRSLRAARVRNKTAARALAELTSLLVDELEKHIELPKLDVIQRLVPPDADRPTVEKVAASLRSAWRLPDGPVANVLAELERHGIVVARLPLKVAEIDAFSVAFEGRPIVVLSSDKGAADRSRFDAAHELGHLVMHRDPDKNEHARIEKQAHWFAAAFLAPSHILVDQLPRKIDWDTFAMLKKRWGLSMASLVMRARDLRCISDGDYARAMKFMSVKGWRKVEPIQLGAPERPVLLGKAVKLLADTVSLRDLAGEAGIPIDLVESIVGASTDPRPRVEI